ncbi:MAG: glycosyltransferase [Chloroflexi bacterium]|nr:glycosyltransferase [Chloroflexota bacterium]
MRILHVYKDYYPVVGGIENHVKHLAEAQAARGHAVTVLVNSLDRRTRVETINGVRVIFAARWLTISSTPLGLALPRQVAREMPDITHLHFPYPWGELANYFFGRARRTVMTYHSDIIRQKYTRALYAPLMWQVLNRVNRILPTSPNYASSSPVLQRVADKCTVVSLAINPTQFECADLHAAQQIRTRMSANAHSPILLFVGHLRYYKGLDYLLRAMPELPGARLLIVGTGPMEGAWRALARDLGLAERVIFAGAVSNAELPAYYAASDIFVLPASERSEAFGLVQLEAMAAGKPVVSTELGTGTSFVNVDGETGFVVPARDSHALAGAIARLMADAELCARQGAAGRARVRREFTLERMVDRVMQVYAEVLARNLIPIGS